MSRDYNFYERIPMRPEFRKRVEKLREVLSWSTINQVLELSTSPNRSNFYALKTVPCDFEKKLILLENIVFEVKRGSNKEEIKV